jgi:hypothetical protein
MPTDAKVSGATPQTANSLSQTWSVPCDAKMSLATTFGSQTFVLTESTLVVKNAASCVGALEGWVDANNSQYLFGSAFMSQVYMCVPLKSKIFRVFISSFRILTVSRDGNNFIGFGNRDLGNQPLSGGSIAGIVVGVVVVTSAIFVGVWFFCRSRRMLQSLKVFSKPPAKEGAIDPYPITPSSATIMQVASPPPSDLGSSASHLESHTIPVTHGLYSLAPTSPDSVSRESWEDVQQRVTMSVQRNEETLGRNVAPNVDVGRDEAHTSFFAATSNFSGNRLPRRAKN